MKNLWLIALLFLLLNTPLFAQTEETLETSGNAFLSRCSVVEKEKSKRFGTDLSNIIACAEYVRGFTTGVQAEQLYAQGKTDGKVVIPAPFCLPSDIPNGQIICVVLKSIRDNPEMSHQPTAIFIMGALKNAFPCSSK